MLEERMTEPEAEEALADPPNNTEPGASMSSMDTQPSPADPPNNT
jgi:hypothetical protein